MPLLVTPCTAASRKPGVSRSGSSNPDNKPFRVLSHAVSPYTSSFQKFYPTPTPQVFSAWIELVFQLLGLPCLLTHVLCRSCGWFERYLLVFVCLFVCVFRALHSTDIESGYTLQPWTGRLHKSTHRANMAVDWM